MNLVELSGSLNFTKNSVWGARNSKKCCDSSYYSLPYPGKRKDDTFQVKVAKWAPRHALVMYRHCNFPGIRLRVSSV